MRTRIGPLVAIMPILVACTGGGDRTTPQPGPITEAVYASGMVKAAGQYNAFAGTSGILTGVLVNEGDSVKAGQPLFLIDDRAAALGERNAELALELSARNARERSPLLRERELAVDLARDRLINDSLLFARQQALWDQRIGSRSEYEQRELAYLAARTAHQNARAALEETRTRLSTELEMARVNLEKSRTGLGDLTVRSLLDGIVFDILIEPGELVSPQSPLAVVGRATDFILELQVDEQDIARVREGQRVLLSMDSHPGETITARVTRIHPILDRRSRTFTVEAVFIDPPEPLYPHLTVEANIVVAYKPDALTIPSDHLVDDRYVINAAGERVEVVTGLRDLRRTEILTGIDSGTVILRP